jgi:YHS domain-containing protein
MSDTNDLARRIQERLSLHDEQRQLRQNHMQKLMDEMDGRLQRYTTAADRLIEAVIRPRLEQMARCLVSLNAPQWECTRHSCRLLFKHTRRFPATAEVELGVTREAEGKTVCVQYQASILPLFVPLERQDQVSMPLDELDEARIADWVDGKLLRFVDSYLRLETSSPYQGGNNATDPVCGMSVNRLDAPAEMEYRGVKYYFCVDECRARFAENPQRYLTSAPPAAAGASQESGGRS